MNNFAHIPTRLHWTAQQLTDAVPLRLHQLYAFATEGRPARAAANGEHRRRLAVAAYAARSPLPPRFCIG
jgi:hypothetical protein